MSSRIPCVALLAAALLVVGSPVAASGQERAVRSPERLRHRDRLVSVTLPSTVVAAELQVAPSGPPARARVARVAPRAAGDVQAPPPAPAPPAPVQPGTMNLVGKALGGGGFGGASGRDVQSPGPPVLDHIELSARRPWVQEKGYVKFFLPYSIDPAAASTDFNTNYPGAMTVVLKVEQGETYLADFAVKSWGAGTYVVETEGGSQEFGDPKGNLEHVLVALQATESGWIDVKFERTEGTGYYLYSVKVDRME